MLKRLIAPGGLLLGALFVLAVVAGVMRSARSADALPPAGVDTLNVTGAVSVTSRLGSESFPVSGNVTFSREDPHLDSGVEVSNAQITDLNLTGTSSTGPVTIADSTVLDSAGEFRSNQGGQQFPASASFDVFIDAVVPASRPQPPFDTLQLHNQDAIHIDSTNNITAWPPTGTTLAADFSGPPAPTPTSPPQGGWPPCAGVYLYPLLPAGVCVTAITLTLGQAKTPAPTDTPCPPEVCGATNTPSPTNTPTEPPGPEDPTFSVGPGGPSGFHPADLLGLTTPQQTVAANDFFANAITIGGAPYHNTQTTAGATVESGEPTSPLSCILGGNGAKSATVWYRFAPTVSGNYTIDTVGSSFDTVLAIYTGSAVNALTPVDCNDDISDSNLQSLVTFSANTGTTYRIQAGGYAGFTGSLNLNMSGPSAGAQAAGPAGGGPPYVRISCHNLGLSNDGCDSGQDGDQDDLDGLSFGSDFGGTQDKVFFSVAPGSQGASGSAVAVQRACSPAEPQADEFVSTLNSDNDLLFDGDGVIVGCPTSYSLHLVERPSSDNLNAITGEPAVTVDADEDGIPDSPIFFSLKAGSPTLSSLGRSAADVLWTVGGFQPGLYASAAALGLGAGDDIDALCVFNVGATTYSPATDKVYFSLAPGSPSLGQIGASAADVLRPGPAIAVSHTTIGLGSTDNIDAMHCAGSPGAPQKVTVPVGDVWYCDSTHSDGNTCETDINVGDTVTWDFSPATAMKHTVTECNGGTCPPGGGTPLFDSGSVPAGSNTTYEFTFNQPGQYYYYCEQHPQAQRGLIVVSGGGGIAGDVNGDGQVTSIDAAFILQYSAGLLSNLPSPGNADVNGDGSIDSLDALLILQYTAGLIDSLPV